MQPEEEIKQEEPMEMMPTEAPEAPAVSEDRTDRGKEVQKPRTGEASLRRLRYGSIY